jgi:cob(I)alamin adenosyltransferase
MRSKIYTKGGDRGQTSLIGGTRVGKNNLRIEAYGTIDELNAFTGLLSTYALEESDVLFLKEIQHKLFNIGSNLATDLDKTSLHRASVIDAGDIQQLEEEIDRMDDELPELNNFVLPGGSAAGAAAHICRTVTRRAERRVIDLNEISPVDPAVLQYINRLSDYFFVLSRYITVNENGTEFFWKK